VDDLESGWNEYRASGAPVAILDLQALSAAVGPAASSPQLILLQDGRSPAPLSEAQQDALCGVLQTPLRSEQVLTLVRTALKLARVGATVQTSPVTTPVWRDGDEQIDQDLLQIILNAKREWQLIFDSFPELLVVVNPQGRVLRLNRAVQQLYGESFANLIGSPLAPALLPLLQCDADSAPCVCENPQLLNRPLQIPGQWEFTALPLQISEETDAVLLSGRDVTERERLRLRQRELELELMHESRLSNIGMLASGLAHNLSTPLQGIIGYTQLICRQYPDEERLVRLQEMTTKLRGIIENLMQKLRRDQLQEECPIDLNQMLLTDLEFMEADLHFKHRIEKDFQLAETLPPVSGIHGDFSQAIMNIISNAIDSMHEQPEQRLTIRTCMEDERVMLEITDTGCGMTPEVLENIFSPFFTTKPSREQRVAEEPTGTGLGLASVRQLLQKYNVVVKVHSTPGSGSSFKLLFPATG